MKKFDSVADYERWTETFENCSDYEMIPVVIDDGWKIAADMMTECKTWKTALKRFAKTFENIPEITGWIEDMKESFENGCYTSSDCSYPVGGIYTIGIENVSENLWYTYINISGVFANR